VYRVNFKIEKEGQNVYNGAKTPRGLYFALKTDIPEVEANTVTYFEKCFVSYKEVSFANQDVFGVEDGFEKVFPLKWFRVWLITHVHVPAPFQKRQPKPILAMNNPIGKIIGINQGMPIEITGV
jgi:hypothetical protein